MGIPEPLSRPSRVYFLDTIRDLVILCVLMWHASVVYATRTSQWWYFKNPDNNALFDVLTILLELFMMPAIFFVSGYFTEASLSKRSFGRFVADKVKRLGVPFILAVGLLMPINGYYAQLGKGVGVSGYFSYWLHDYFWEAPLIGHLWFLPVLLFLFLGTGVLWSIAKWIDPDCLESGNGSAREPSVVGMFMLGVVTAVSLILINHLLPFGDWRYIFGVKYLPYQPSRMVVNVFYFFLGIYARRQRWFSALPSYLQVTVWLVGAGVFSLGYLVFRMLYGRTMDDSTVLIVGNSVLRCFSIVCLFMGTMLMARRWLNTLTPIQRLLSQNSYSMYIIHQPLVVVPLQYHMLGWHVSCWVKFPIVLVATLGLSLVLSHYVFRRIPGLRDIL